MGNRVFGCDDCQDVCPWNRFARPSRLQEEFSPRADLHAVELIGLLGLSDSDFKEKFRGSPLLRAKRKGLARNVAVAIGNSGDPDSVPVLERALNDPEPLVRGHVAWALGEIRTDRAMAVLERCIRTEPSDEVIAEVARALQGPLRR
jgi:epoxyqueuosine reductase